MYKDGNKGRICRVDVALVDKKNQFIFLVDTAIQNNIMIS